MPQSSLSEDVMGSPARKFDDVWTYADYMTWNDGQRWEIVDGVAYAMSPAPAIRHQSISGNLAISVLSHFKDTECAAFQAPTDVVFDDLNVVQPDLLVVCDRNKITEANITGAPDLIIEILSPSTMVRDRREKLALYERFGVREYLIIHPVDEIVERYLLSDGRYGSPEIFDWTETLTLGIFPDLTLNLWEIFDKKLPTEAPVKRGPLTS
jgi:Uma2 family endonuclease